MASGNCCWVKQSWQMLDCSTTEIHCSSASGRTLPMAAAAVVSLPPDSVNLSSPFPALVTGYQIASFFTPLCFELVLKA